MNPAAPFLLGIAVLGGYGLAALRRRLHARRQLHAVAERLERLGTAPGGLAVGAVPGLRGGRDLPPGLPVRLKRLLLRADYVPDGSALALLAAAALALGGALGWRIGPLVGAAGALCVLAAGPIALHVLANRRIAALREGMPFFIDGIRQVLMAGGSLQQALLRASASTAPALRRFLAPMIRRIDNGAAPGDSLVWLAERLDLAELHMFAAAVQASMRYGGRLSAVLANLATTLRERSRIERELRAATAETRVSAMLIGGLPAIAGLAMGLLNPHYADFFLGNPTGHRLLAIALGLQLAGVLAMRRLMRLDY